MVRTQVQLTEEQASALKKLAEKRGVSVAGLLRQSVERLLKEDEERREEIWRRALSIPSFHSGYTDISVNHDKYLAEDFM